MQITFDNFRNVKYFFAIIAAGIVALSVYFTDSLATEMAEEEHQRIELWADATRLLLNDISGSDFNFILKVLEDNNTIPVMIAGMDDEVITYRNIEIKGSDTLAFLQKKLAELKTVHPPIEMQLDVDFYQYLYYDDSILLKKLAYYPFVQGGIIIVFFCVLFFFFASAKKSEQNRVWVGLSKETAHQLGTPISSLMAWMEIIKGGSMPEEMIPEMEKDVNRLQVIAERFSKIGSKPELTPTLLREVVDNTLSYMQKRTSSRIVISSVYETEEPIYVDMNPPLFAWVLENLCKNAIDAIGKEGSITAYVSLENDNRVCIDVHDTGKGIPKSKYKTVFNPGYTTKKRGWGLGLSLVKRIVEEYHHGKIYVKKSEIGKGTVFRILLKRGERKD